MLFKSGNIAESNMNNMNKATYVYECGILAVLAFAMAIFLWDKVEFYDMNKVKGMIFFYGWAGILIYGFCLFTWKKSSDFLFCPYTVFLSFMFIFNYGQFLMWALGIHYEGELGTTTFIRYMDQYTLLKVEIVAAFDFLFFHFGALFATLRKNRRKLAGKQAKNAEINKEMFFRALKVICTAVAVMSMPVVLYYSVKNMQVAFKYGYTATYYGSNVNEMTPLMKYMSYMFFPALMGIWIGNKFSKKSFVVICCLFAPYMFINLVSGDRGSWIYAILILAWCYFTYVKKLRAGDVIRSLVLIAVGLTVVSVLVKFRDLGLKTITMEDFSRVLSDASFVFIKPFFEMGQSANVLGIIVQDNMHDAWQYGNTYMAAISSMLVPRVKLWFGYPDFYLDNYLSQTYLGMPYYGVGFSITGEAFLNGGLAWSPVIMLLVGAFFGMALNCSRSDLSNPEKMFMVLSSVSLFPIARGSFEFNLRVWTYGTLLIMFITQMLKKMMVKHACHK